MSLTTIRIVFVADRVFLNINKSWLFTWQFDDSGLIKESKGRFDTEEYERQVKNGVEN